MMDCIRSTYRNEGIMAFMKGVTSPIAAITFITATEFGTWQLNRQLILAIQGKPSDGHLNVLEEAFSGIGVGLVTSLAYTPMELVKTRLQMQYQDAALRKYKGTWHATTTIFKEEGLRGLFKGLDAMMWRESLGNMAYFGGYCFFKSRLVRDDGKYKELSMMLAGGLSGLAYWCTIHPFDTLKSKMQANPSLFPTLGVTLRASLKNGIGKLYVGLMAGAARAFVANSVGWVVFEMLISSLEQYKKYFTGKSF